MRFIAENSWGIFITIEIVALVCLLFFIGARYILSLRKISTIFLGLFLFTMVLEGVLAFLVYKETGTISTFQIVIVIFLIYAATFGRSDFKKLDYTARGKIGKWRNISLVTDDEVEEMAYLKHPKTVARKARYWFYAHTVIFLGALIYFWNVYGTSEASWVYFLQQRSWFNDEALLQPFTSEMLNQVIRLWVIIYIVDTVVNWSYTLFPNRSSDDV